MSFRASDGRWFPSNIQRVKYENWLKEEGKAPGGPTHIHDLTEHGPVKKITITREGMGRHHVEAEHQDGYKHSSVHPDAQRAHGIMGEMLQIEPPPSQKVHQRSRAHPVGDAEKKRVDQEDSQVENKEEEQYT